MLGSSLRVSQLASPVGLRQNNRTQSIIDVPRGERILSRQGGIPFGRGYRLGFSARSMTARAIAEPVDMSTREHIVTIHTPADLEDLVKSDELVVLQCKAKACRPCKAFTQKYARIANQYPDVVFAEVTGDESNETRRMMMKMKVTTTPSFFLFSNGKEAHRFSGANKENLMSAIEEHLLTGDKDSVDGSMDEGNFRLKLQGA